MVKSTPGMVDPRNFPWYLQMGMKAAGISSPLELTRCGGCRIISFGEPRKLIFLKSTPKPTFAWAVRPCGIVKQGYSQYFEVFSTFHFAPTALSSFWKVLIFRHRHFFVTHRGVPMRKCSFFAADTFSSLTGGFQLPFRTMLEKVFIFLFTFSSLKGVPTNPSDV